MTKRKGCLFVISGPSGVGKGTLRERLFQCIPDLKYSVSVTSRKPRESEVEGKDYYFVDEEKFKKYIKENKFAEWALVYGEYKGTLLKTIQESTDRGKDLVLEIDVQGAMQIKKKFPDGVFIFIAPPSWEKLEYRLRNRKTEGEKELQKRLNEAHDEMKYVQHYNYLIINHHLEKALKELAAIIISERCKISQDELGKNNPVGDI
ncbi:MAG: guanylate kinase [Candidatus Atribacteria bacterium]|nr:guanylate kinase [Candidatus Atribacteria bacterium]